MSLSLEIISPNGSSVDLDRWCRFVKVEGYSLVGFMQFGTPVIGTDTDEVIDMKRVESIDECDAFLDAIAPYEGKTVTVLYNAINPIEVRIPENGGLSLDGKYIYWLIQMDDETGKTDDAGKTEEVAPKVERKVKKREEIAHAPQETVQIPTAIAQELLDAIKELTSAIKGKRGKQA